MEHSANPVLDALLADVLSGSKTANDLAEEEVVELRRKLNPFSRSIAIGSKPGYYAYSLINLQEEYMKKFLMTGLIGFLYRMNEEYGISDGEYVTRVSELDRNQVAKEFIEANLIGGKVRPRDDLYKKPVMSVSGGENFSQEEDAINKFKRIIIQDFLDDIFKLNPDVHVRTAYRPNPSDPERNPIPKKVPEVPEASPQQQTYLSAISRIPPMDTFERWRLYIDRNYDALRKATNDIYADKPDLDYVLIIYNHFDTEDDYKKFLNKHENDVTVSIKCVEQNKWCFQGNFSNNRERESFYTKNTRVLQEILEHQESMQKLGKDMVHKRIAIKKEQNKREVGEDDPGFVSGYQKKQKEKHAKAGLLPLSKAEIEQRRLEDKYLGDFGKPDPVLESEKDAIQVDVWMHNTQTRKLDSSSFFTRAENVDPESVGILTAKTE